MQIEERRRCPTVAEPLGRLRHAALPHRLCDRRGFANGLFWGALAFALLVAFVVTVPVNRWLLARGKGHAVIHQHHHHGSHA